MAPESDLPPDADEPRRSWNGAGHREQGTATTSATAPAADGPAADGPSQPAGPWMPQEPSPPWAPEPVPPFVPEPAPLFAPGAPPSPASTLPPGGPSYAPPGMPSGPPSPQTGAPPYVHYPWADPGAGGDAGPPAAAGAPPLAPLPLAAAQPGYANPASPYAGPGPATAGLPAAPRRRADRRADRGPGAPRRNWLPVLVGGQFVLIALLVAAIGVLVVRTDSTHDDLTALQSQEAKVQDRLTTAESDAGATRGDVSDILGTLEKAAAADPAAIASRIQPSVFTIIADNSQGSAWVVESSGNEAQLVTNFHVVADLVGRGEKNVTLIGGDGAQFGGVIVQTAEPSDLALIKVNRKLPALTTSTDVPEAGSPLLVIGSPLGLGNSVTTGSVSAQERKLEDGNVYVQFSAPISPGNSGGPVVDSFGNVVGVATAKVVEQGAEGIGFALPVSQVCDQFDVCK